MIVPSQIMMRHCRAFAGSGLLDLADNLASTAQTLDHLLTLLPPADGVVALLEQIVQLVVAIHVLQKLALHLVLGEPEMEG